MFFDIVKDLSNIRIFICAVAGTHRMEIKTQLLRKVIKDKLAVLHFIERLWENSKAPAFFQLDQHRLKIRNERPEPRFDLGIKAVELIRTTLDQKQDLRVL